jgi:hypothetical protein|tara:strand:- start:278 stop:517 length:240 start_codon:yes stop_codon:yes gene_type:complete
MAYISKTGLKVSIGKKNGQETIEFIEFDTTYQDTYIQYITEYFNPVIGIYDESKTQIYFEGNDTLLIDQSFIVTSGELT